MSIPVFNHNAPTAVNKHWLNSVHKHKRGRITVPHGEVFSLHQEPIYAINAPSFSMLGIDGDFEMTPVGAIFRGQGSLQSQNLMFVPQTRGQMQTQNQQVQQPQQLQQIVQNQQGQVIHIQDKWTAELEHQSNVQVVIAPGIRNENVVKLGVSAGTQNVLQQQENQQRQQLLSLHQLQQPQVYHFPTGQIHSPLPVISAPAAVVEGRAQQQDSSILRYVPISSREQQQQQVYIQCAEVVPQLYPISPNAQPMLQSIPVRLVEESREDVRMGGTKAQNSDIMIQFQPMPSSVATVLRPTMASVQQRSPQLQRPIRLQSLTPIPITAQQIQGLPQGQRPPQFQPQVPQAPRPRLQHLQHQPISLHVVGPSSVQMKQEMQIPNQQQQNTTSPQVMVPRQLSAPVRLHPVQTAPRAGLMSPPGRRVAESQITLVPQVVNSQITHRATWRPIVQALTTTVAQDNLNVKKISIEEYRAKQQQQQPQLQQPQLQQPQLQQPQQQQELNNMVISPPFNSTPISPLVDAPLKVYCTKRKQTKRDATIANQSSIQPLRLVGPMTFCPSPDQSLLRTASCSVQEVLGAVQPAAVLVPQEKDGRMVFMISDRTLEQGSKNDTASVPAPSLEFLPKKSDELSNTQHSIPGRGIFRGYSKICTPVARGQSSKATTIVSTPRATPHTIISDNSSSSLPETIKVTAPVSSPSPTVTSASFSPVKAAPTTSSVTSPVITTPTPPPKLPVRLIPGKLALCRICGACSPDFNTCTGCRRVLPPDSKQIDDKATAVTSTTSTTPPPPPGYLLPGSKVTPKSTTNKETPTERFIPLSSTTTGVGTTTIKLTPVRKQPVRKKKVVEEPVCLTISDDEEPSSSVPAPKPVGRGPRNSNSQIYRQITVDSDVTQSILLKEPNYSLFDNDSPLEMQHDLNLERYLEGATDSACSLITCRTVRIGSYKAVPMEPVLIAAEGIRIVVPFPGVGGIQDTRIKVVVEIAREHLLSVLCHFGRSMPVLFLYPSSSICSPIRDVLGMTGTPDAPHEPYLNPKSFDETHKRITLLPERLLEDDKMIIKQLFSHPTSIYQELEVKEANAILVKASPKDLSTGPTTRSVRQAQPSAPKTSETKELLVFPPPPLKAGIALNTEDYSCLGQNQFLNDAIIDFYLKYLLQCKLSSEDKARTHVFSSFFYKRLTTRHLNRKSLDTVNAKLPPAEQRHARVKSWTKNVNIFEKDFLIIPINENSHWFLAIICFPGLTGCVSMVDGAPVTLPRPLNQKGKKSWSSDAEKSPQVDTTSMPHAIQIGCTTITGPVGTTFTLHTIGSASASKRLASVLDSDNSDRDEADGDDEDLMNTEDDDSMPSKEVAEDNKKPDSTSESHDKPEGNTEGLQMEVTEDGDIPAELCSPSKRVEEVVKQASNEELVDYSEEEEEADKPGPVKRPCILIFDSLCGTGRHRVVATLRDYLRIEYRCKLGKYRAFGKDEMRGASMKVPQQNNFTDCGVYVLQYVESFFDTPIQDYSMPIRNLQDWFPAEVVGGKREKIAKLIQHLMNEQNIDIELPKISFSSVLPPVSDPLDSKELEANVTLLPESEKEFVVHGISEVENSDKPDATKNLTASEDATDSELRTATEVSTLEDQALPGCVVEMDKPRPVMMTIISGPMEFIPVQVPVEVGPNESEVAQITGMDYLQSSSPNNSLENEIKQALAEEQSSRLEVPMIESQHEVVVETEPSFECSNESPASSGSPASSKSPSSLQESQTSPWHSPECPPKALETWPECQKSDEEDLIIPDRTSVLEVSEYDTCPLCKLSLDLPVIPSPEYPQCSKCFSKRYNHLMSHINAIARAQIGRRRDFSSPKPSLELQESGGETCLQQTPAETACVSLREEGDLIIIDRTSVLDASKYDTCPRCKLSLDLRVLPSPERSQCSKCMMKRYNYWMSFINHIAQESGGEACLQQTPAETACVSHRALLESIASEAKTETQESPPDSPTTECHTCESIYSNLGVLADMHNNQEEMSTDSSAETENSQTETPGSTDTLSVGILQKSALDAEPFAKANPALHTERVIVEIIPAPSSAGHTHTLPSSSFTAIMSTDSDPQKDTSSVRPKRESDSSTLPSLQVKKPCLAPRSDL